MRLKRAKVQEKVNFTNTVYCSDLPHYFCHIALGKQVTRPSTDSSWGGRDAIRKASWPRAWIQGSVQNWGRDGNLYITMTLCCAVNIIVRRKPTGTERPLDISSGLDTGHT